MGERRHVERRPVVARTHSLLAEAEACVDRAVQAQRVAQREGERARHEYLRAIHVRQAVLRRRRTMYGPVFAMADIAAGHRRRLGDPVTVLAESVGHYAIFKLDRHGHVLTWNPEAQHLLGYVREEIVGQHYSVFADGQFPGPAAPPDVLSDTHYEEGWRARKDGSRFWASVALTPIYGDDGRLAGFAFLIRDDSARAATDGDQEVLEELEARSLATEALLNNVVERLFGIGIGLAPLSSALAHEPDLAARIDRVTADFDELIRYIRTTMWSVAEQDVGFDTEKQSDAHADGGRDGLRILVVDDDEDMRALFSSVLCELGEVHAVADAYQALACIEHDTVDVLVLDVLLPGASGIDLLERIHDLGHDVPAVVVSGVDGGSLHRRALDSGATVVMSKPFDKRLLQATVLEAVRTKMSSSSGQGAL